MTTAQQNAILACIANGGSFTNTATLYLGVCTGGVTAGGVITGEPTDPTGGYTRKSVAMNGTAVFGAAAAGAVTNSAAAINFAQSSAAWSTGASNLTTWFLATAQTAGTVLYYGALGTPMSVNAANITMGFATSQLTLSIANV